jgi:hypothetical protein
MNTKPGGKCDICGETMLPPVSSLSLAKQREVTREAYKIGQYWWKSFDFGKRQADLFS